EVVAHGPRRGTRDVGAFVEPDADAPLVVDGGDVVAGDRSRTRRADLDRLAFLDDAPGLAADGLLLIACDGDGLLVADLHELALLDRPRAVAPDVDVEIALGMQVDLLGARGVFERELVEALAARRALGAHAAPRRILGEVERVRPCAVVDRPEHHWTVGI